MIVNPNAADSNPPGVGPGPEEEPGSGASLQIGGRAAAPEQGSRGVNPLLMSADLADPGVTMYMQSRGVLSVELLRLNIYQILKSPLYFFLEIQKPVLAAPLLRSFLLSSLVHYLLAESSV